MTTKRGGREISKKLTTWFMNDPLIIIFDATITIHRYILQSSRRLYKKPADIYCIKTCQKCIFKLKRFDNQVLKILWRSKMGKKFNVHSIYCRISDDIVPKMYSSQGRHRLSSDILISDNLFGFSEFYYSLEYKYICSYK